jgi:hypothetical protein
MTTKKTGASGPVDTLTDADMVTEKALERRSVLSLLGAGITGSMAMVVGSSQAHAIDTDRSRPGDPASDSDTGQGADPAADSDTNRPGDPKRKPRPRVDSDVTRRGDPVGNSDSDTGQGADPAAGDSDTTRQGDPKNGNGGGRRQSDTADSDAGQGADPADSD